MAGINKVTPRTAAQRLGVSLSHLYHLLWAGKLPATQQEGRWCIPTTAVEARLKAKKERYGAPSR